MALNARSINRVVAALLFAFTLIAIGMAYWTVIAANDLVARSDNPRQVEAEQTQRRGALYDRTGKLLSHSVANGQTAAGQPFLQRVYPEPDAISATGYFNVVHGVSGAEQAFDQLLRGLPISSSQQDTNDLLHRPAVGQDVRLTIDLAAQQAAATAMRFNGVSRGAVVAIDVPSGAIRVLLSLPGYDPNTFDDPGRFNALLHDPTAPLLNRAIQGVYQPGGALETVVLSALITAKVPIDQSLVNVTQPVVMPDLTVNCSLNDTTTIARTWQGAFMAACPAPFAQAAIDHSADLKAAIQAFGLNTAPTIANFSAIDNSITPTATPISVSAAQWLAQGVGQGSLTVSPLQMALVAAIIANNGNSMPLYLADASRAPESNTWQPLPITNDQPAVIAHEAATAIRNAMQQTVANGTASAAQMNSNRTPSTVTGTPGFSPMIYGHASLAYSGLQKTPLAWFIGFVDLANGRSLAIAVILEDTSDLNIAARIGGQTLQTFASQP